ncbi:hypothetical protein [Natrialba swarupiae]|uniref:DUF8159 domain-containing protein n=1 Tax=Natrialba swarupiae TaxID=2448032 RepID=A0A5D5AL15_9EURY|nr:hypothetical protein [Natrialba swarupiae]TYT61635.1 hypothetical protein FYC77_12250 [Natrialba swarupiae]
MRKPPVDTADAPDESGRRHDSEESVAKSRLSRRQTLGAVGSLTLSLTAGCLGVLPDDTRVAAEPEAPGDDPQATAGEFHHLLEDNGITVDELYHDTEDDDLVLFYESDATNREESDEEIGLIYVVYRDGIVAEGGSFDHLYTEVGDRFEGQVEGWGANSRWAQRDLDGEIGEMAVWNAIVDTMVYPDGTGRHGEELSATGVHDHEYVIGSNTNADRQTL